MNPANFMDFSANGQVCGKIDMPATIAQDVKTG